MRAIVIRDTGEAERLDLATFEELQKACGGTVIVAGERQHREGQYVESPSILADSFAHLTMWCNEEAQIHGMLPNHKATILVGWWEAVYPDGSQGMLYGDVVLTGPTS